MTIEEAIKHAKEVAYKLETNCEQCATEHRQLADWLSDYKRLLNQEPCDDAISRQAVIDTTICEGISCNECSFNDIDGESGCLLHDRISKLPSVSPTRPKGKWKPFDFPWFECSECGAVRNNKSFFENFCPNCGAYMIQVESEDKE